MSLGDFIDNIARLKVTTYKFGFMNESNVYGDSSLTLHEMERKRIIRFNHFAISNYKKDHKL